MLLDFDINKAIAAAAYIIQRKGGRESMFVLLKKLYWADRTALIDWGKSITGDSLASLNMGPVVSGIYDLLKNKGSQKNLILWNDVIHRNGNNVSLRKNANETLLSEREIETLDKAIKKIDSIKGPIYKWTHANCREWKNPRGSSIPIDPSEILRIAGKTEEEILFTEKANYEVRMMSYFLNGR
jgi:uncharacterized phage-associated protein